LPTVRLDSGLNIGRAIHRWLS